MFRTNMQNSFSVFVSFNPWFGHFTYLGPIHFGPYVSCTGIQSSTWYWKFTIQTGYVSREDPGHSCDASEDTCPDEHQPHTYYAKVPGSFVLLWMTGLGSRCSSAWWCLWWMGPDQYFFQLKALCCLFPIRNTAKVYDFLCTTFLLFAKYWSQK